MRPLERARLGVIAEQIGDRPLDSGSHSVVSNVELRDALERARDRPARQVAVEYARIDVGAPRTWT